MVPRLWPTFTLLPLQELFSKLNGLTVHGAIKVCLSVGTSQIRFGSLPTFTEFNEMCFLSSF